MNKTRSKKISGYNTSNEKQDNHRDTLHHPRRHSHVRDLTDHQQDGIRESAGGAVEEQSRAGSGYNSRRPENC